MQGMNIDAVDWKTDFEEPFSQDGFELKNLGFFGMQSFFEVGAYFQESLDILPFFDVPLFGVFAFALHDSFGEVHILFFDFELDIDELEGDARDEHESNELLFLLLVDLREFLPFFLLFWLLSLLFLNDLLVGADALLLFDFVFWRFDRRILFSDSCV